MNLNLRVEREFLPFVNKPGRYTGNEYNAVRKSPDAVEVRALLAFPELYELGMSYMGFDILYHVLNNRTDIWAERVYAPWFDAEEILRAKNIPLFSLESRSALSSFDLIGFTLQYELTYSTLLNMLDLGQILLRSGDRKEVFPLIIGGGPSGYNPEPIADFFDAFLLGDGEEAVLEICEVIKEGKRNNLSKLELLTDLSKISGMYIPSFYKVIYDQFGDFKEIQPDQKEASLPVSKRILQELSQNNYSMNPLVPLIEITHDRLAVEVMRGCSEGCRFCNAGMIYRPVRERSVDNIVLQSREAIQNSGYDELSLLSLNTSDFQDLQWLMVKEKSLLSDQRLSFSFPSLRLDGLTPEMVDFVKTFRKGGFTFAPEAGSQRLRNVINKNLQEKDILDTLRLILENGWQLVKFYFMIGLPTEKQEDLDAIVELVQKCVEISKSYKDVNVNVSLSPFSPKPHTPFQWEKQEYPEVLEQKSRYLLDRLNHPRVSVSWRDGYTSSLETIFNRGGRELAGVLEEAWMQGARFDGWQEGFDWSRWQKAFLALGVDWKKYLRPLSVSVPLVWDHIDMGISKAFLQKEKTRAYEGRISPDCRDQVCLGCGLQRKEFENLVKCFRGEQNQKVVSQSSTAQASTVLPADNAQQNFGRSTKKRVSATQVVKKRIRLRFTKTGLTRFISHLDIIRIFDRAARRAKISLVYSQGFHPRPKMAFGPPLGLGIASIAEYVDMEAEIGREADFQPRLNQVLPEGIEIVTQKPIFTKVPSLASAINRITYETFMENQEIDELWIEQVLSQEEILLTRQVKEKEREIDIRPFIHSIQKMNHSLIITLDALEGRMAKISEVLQALLEKHGLDYREFLTQRTGQFIKKGDEVLDPLQVI